MLKYFLLFITKFLAATFLIFLVIGDLDSLNIDHMFMNSLTLLFIFLSFYIEDKINSDDKAYKYVMVSCIVFVVLINFSFYLYTGNGLDESFFGMLILVIIIQILNTIKHIKKEGAGDKDN